jgi:hypothetical protein
LTDVDGEEKAGGFSDNPYRHGRLCCNSFFQINLFGEYGKQVAVLAVAGAVVFIYWFGPTMAENEAAYLARL